MKCERCGRPGSEVCGGEAVLCELCLVQVIREWKIRFSEYGILSAEGQAR